MKSLALGLLLLSGSAIAVEAIDKNEDLIRQQIKLSFPDVAIGVIRKSPYAGLYQASVGGDVLYLSPDGKFMIYGGTLLGLQAVPGAAVINHTQAFNEELDNMRAPLRANELNKPELIKGSLTFAAAKQQYEVFVFTDIDCGYCQKLHRDMKRINELGITVHYLAFPRAGLRSASHEKLISVWCSDNPQKAMTAAKSGQQLQTRTCKNDLDKHYDLVQKFGLSGTPAIVLKNGTLLPGYVPPERLLEMLKKAKT